MLNSPLLSIAFPRPFNNAYNAIAADYCKNHRQNKNNSFIGNLVEEWPCFKDVYPIRNLAQPKNNTTDTFCYFP